MKTSFRCLFLFLLILCVVYLCDARGGGGRGGRGRGRGRSGARGGGVRAKSTVKSGVRGSSSYYGGVRTGTSGYKVGTKTPTSSNYGSKDFSKVMLGTATSHRNHIQMRGGHPFVIVAAAAPIFYDDRNYHWSYHSAIQNQNLSRNNIVCEYVFGSDDGELQNLTFQNGTAARSVFFGCQGWVDCCGMYCCHDFRQYFELFFIFVFVLFFVWIARYAAKTEIVWDKKDTPKPDPDTKPLRDKSPRPKGKSPVRPQNKKPQAKKPQTQAPQAKTPYPGYHVRL